LGYSYNAWLGHPSVYPKQASVTNPAGTFLFIDSIPYNNASFVTTQFVETPYTISEPEIGGKNAPAGVIKRHQGGYNFVAVDGHVEHRTVFDNTIIRPE
jgi:prepilin-type processing-associated H-X9-DG protein